MCCKMFFIFLYAVFLLGVNGVDPICSKSSGSSCPTGTSVLGGACGDPSGTVISHDEQNCKITKCMNKKIRTYACGAIANGCCYHQNKLYGNGDVITSGEPRPGCDGCKQQFCHDGQVIWKTCTGCTGQCCKFGDDIYQPGKFTEETCAKLMCDGDTGLFNFEGLEPSCPMCKAYLDPHIYTYGHPLASYKYQGCGSYSLSQVFTSSTSYTPKTAVFSSFKLCGHRWSVYFKVSCVDTVTFINDDDTFPGATVTIEFKAGSLNIQVKDVPHPISIIGKNIVQPIDNKKSVLAWRSDEELECVNFQGTGGFLVKFCGSESEANSVYLWPNNNINGALKGLCGTVKGTAVDDFIGRNGHNYGPWTKIAPVEFVKSWLTAKTGTDKCDPFPGRTHRVKRQTQNRCEANSTVLDDLQDQCEITVSNGMSHSDKAAQGLIDDCVYDLCNVSNPNEWIKAVQEAVQVEVDIQRETHDCTCNRWCWKRSGYCTKFPENCNGLVRDRGCDGQGCFCCFPECRNRMKGCYLEGGFCTTFLETCAGNTTTGCRGQDCECCLEPDRCIPKRKCWKHGGSCIPSSNWCDGRIIENACKSENCHCCVNQSMC